MYGRYTTEKIVHLHLEHVKGPFVFCLGNINTNELDRNTHTGTTTPFQLYYIHFYPPCEQKSMYTIFCYFLHSYTNKIAFMLFPNLNFDGLEKHEQDMSKLELEFHFWKRITFKVKILEYYFAFVYQILYFLIFNRSLEEIYYVIRGIHVV